MNLRLEHLKDKRVRQAMLHALDRKFVSDNLWFGFAKPATGPIASSSPFYTTQGVPQYPYDVARANAILDEAGYKRGAGNMRFKVALTFRRCSPRSPTAEYIKQALARVGIDVELRNIDLHVHPPGLQLGVRADPELLYLLPDPSLRAAALHQQQHQKGTPFANAAGYENRRGRRLRGRADRERRAKRKECSPASSA
jgi:peptide/nickel transport system substrate-binding protein